MDLFSSGAWVMRRMSLVPPALFTMAAVAFPCGGSYVDFVDGPLVSAYTFAEQALNPVLDFDFNPRDEVRFLPGLYKADTARMAALVNRVPLSARWPEPTLVPRVSEPSAVAMNAAWARGDVDAAVGAARAVVSRVMELQASDDSVRNEALRLAVETIDLAPMVVREPAATRRAAFERLAAPYRAVSFDSLPQLLAQPVGAARRASLEYAAVRVAMRTKIPDALREEIAKQVAPATWDSLYTMQRTWLQRYPDHPYAGLMEFLRLRTFFLASQSDSAWRTAIRLYAAYPARAGMEMRYLLLTGTKVPTGVLVDTRVPQEIRASLVGNVRPTQAEWNALMQLSVQESRAPWSENLQERLLAELATDLLAPRTLPSTFPAWRPSASLLWRYLYATNALRAGQVARAMPFVTTLAWQPSDTALSVSAAMLATRIHLQRGEWIAALKVRGVDEWTKRYLLRALAPDSVADRLAVGSDPLLAREARLVLANRAAQAGRWSEAATVLQASDAARAARYRTLGGLSVDTSSNGGLLRFARGAAAAQGKVFFESRRYFHRGLVSREWAISAARGEDPWELPWSRADERRRLYAYFKRSAEPYLALRLYASYLNRPGLSASERRTAVREANGVYRGLLRIDPSRTGDGFWGDSLAGMPEAAVLRRAGR
jgi:hypothetical protein